LAKLYGHIETVKVKTAELKNNLSRYLRRIRETGETIVICDRDKPVAMLGPLPVREPEKNQAEFDELQLRFAEAGLELRRPIIPMNQLPEVKTKPAPDGRTEIITVQEMRRSRDW
jgi:antitoxin (DNA-binding transcriptional repressor) of toxin-antitoxin stability system